MEAPAESCITILQDHGPNDGGWGTAAVSIPGLGLPPAPFVYCGEDPEVIPRLVAVCRLLAQNSGKPTRLVRFTVREDLAVFGGSS